MTKFFSWFGLPGSFVLTVLLSSLALVLALLFRTQDRWLCLAAMLLSTMGDLVLMNWKGIGTRMPVPYFYVGAVLFIAAHCFYTAAYASLIRNGGYSFRNPGFWIGIVLILLVGISVSLVYFYRLRFNGMMYGLCMVYLCVIGCMLVTVFSYAWSVWGLRSLVALGALSFFLSDLIIGLDKLLYLTTPRLQDMIWELYPIGQVFLLIFG